MNVPPSSLLCTSAVVLGGSWTPASLSNKVGWWRASDITGKSDGDSVTAWPDSFGLLSDATGSGTYRTGANGIGGVQVIEFNGATYMDTPIISLSGDLFVWCVYQNNFSSLRRFLGTSGNSFAVAFSSSTALRVDFVAVRTIYAALGTGYFFQGRNGTSGIFETDATESTNTVATTAITGQWGIGAQYNGQFPAPSLCAEVGFLSGYPSADDLTNLRAYINTTYGITTS